MTLTIIESGKQQDDDDADADNDDDDVDADDDDDGDEAVEKAPRASRVRMKGEMQRPPILIPSARP